MKRRQTNSKQASVLQTVLSGALISVSAISLVSSFQAARPLSPWQLTLADRVAYQSAIEEVYWRHRIWPEENARPKPLLEEVISSVQVQQKVEEYLRNSQLLSKYWKQPITSGQLQDEMERMARHTKQPEVLHELFAALDNDPAVIAECLARPVLSERLVTELSVQEPLELSSATAEIGTLEAADESADGYILPAIAGPSIVYTSDSWRIASVTDAPSLRGSHTAVWTGSEMIIWGGNGDTFQLNTGGRYTPSTDSWTATTTTNAPEGRYGHTAVWTGSEMIVWGGAASVYSTNGGRYNPSTNSWVATTTTNVPAGRTNHSAVWTGSEMIVWGGFSFDGSSIHYMNTGGRYDPTTESWVATTTVNAPVPRSIHTAVWTGSEMIIWGGYSGSGSFYQNTGGRYNPSTDSWIATTINNAPTARTDYAALWTGSEMIIWGGYNGFGFGYLNSGGRYNPNTDNWVATAVANSPSVRGGSTVVWTGKEMIVWGGEAGGSSSLNTGGRYTPSNDSWVTTTTTLAPAARYFHTAVWTGSEMIVWGGSNGSSYMNTGGTYGGQPPPSSVIIAGTVQYCASAAPHPVPNVTLTLTGGSQGSTSSDAVGNYLFAGLSYGGNYSVLPSKAARVPGVLGINTSDVVAAQRHFLAATVLTGCRLKAADVTGDSVVNIVDVIGIQRFFLGLSTGIVNSGKYQFSPPSRTYSVIVSDRNGQNYDTLVFGDIVSPFVE